MSFGLQNWLFFGNCNYFVTIIGYRAKFFQLQVEFRKLSCHGLRIVPVNNIIPIEDGWSCDR